MATIAAQLTVEDYAKWRLVFDRRKSVREKASVRTEHVYCNPDNITSHPPKGGKPGVFWETDIEEYLRVSLKPGGFI